LVSDAFSATIAVAAPSMTILAVAAVSLSASVKVALKAIWDEGSISVDSWVVSTTVAAAPERPPPACAGAMMAKTTNVARTASPAPTCFIFISITSVSVHIQMHIKPILYPLYKCHGHMR